ncbi:hypothetical protein M1N80_03520 [Peptococcaceae bacterium]|nr:hypothetical protein [Peptococcaceae bacterium]
MKTDWNKILKLIFVSFIIFSCTYLFNVVLGSLPAFQQAWERIKYKDIEAGGIFYTDTPEARDGGFYIRSYKNFAELRKQISCTDIDKDVDKAIE